MPKAYIVYEDGFREEHSILVFAESSSKARSLAFYQSELDAISFFSLRANRLSRVDTLARKQEPYIEYDLKVLREAGFQFEDGRSCDSCGLSDCDEDRWRVCCICRQCPECGYDKDCGNHEDMAKVNLAVEIITGQFA